MRNITTLESASAFCTAAAAERGANWPGLFWTQRPGEPSSCALTARTPGAVQPIIYSSNCDYPLEQIAVGQVVVPAFGAGTTPWIDGPRYNPGLMGSDTMTYPQRGRVSPPPEGAPRLDIAWEELPQPSNPRQMWALVRLPDGSIGWADFEALVIELGLEDE